MSEVKIVEVDVAALEKALGLVRPTPPETQGCSGGRTMTEPVGVTWRPGPARDPSAVIPVGEPCLMALYWDSPVSRGTGYKWTVGVRSGPEAGAEWADSVWDAFSAEYWDVSEVHWYVPLRELNPPEHEGY